MTTPKFHRTPIRRSAPHSNALVVVESRIAGEQRVADARLASIADWSEAACIYVKFVAIIYLNRIVKPLLIRLSG